MIFIILLHQLVNGYYYGEYISLNDKFMKNNTFLYYYDPLYLQTSNYTALTFNKNKTKFRCNNDKDCQKNWCTSGSICSKEKFCINSMDYPCHHTMECNANLKICEIIKCFTVNQCDDNIFCNGKEYCVNRICKRTEYPCKYGTCIETTKSCTFINNVTKDNNETMFKTSSILDNIYDNNYVNLTDMISINMNGPPLWDPNDPTIQIIWLVVFIIFAVLVIGLCVLTVFIPCCKRK